MTVEQIVSRARNVRRRAVHAFSAQLLLRLVVIGQQVLLTPLFLTKWGIDGYAAWIAVSAVASFASIGSAGLGQAVSAEILFKTQTNDRSGTIGLFSSAIS